MKGNEEGMINKLQDEVYRPVFKDKDKWSK